MDKGISYPFERGDKGYFKIMSGIELIEGNILQIIGTIPGERVMIPDFGCKIRTLLFDHINIGTMALVKTYVVDAIKKWEKRVVLLQVDLYANEDKSFMTLQLQYRYKETGEERQTSMMVNKEGVKLLNGNITKP